MGVYVISIWNIGLEADGRLLIIYASFQKILLDIHQKIRKYLWISNKHLDVFCV